MTAMRYCTWPLFTISDDLAAMPVNFSLNRNAVGNQGQNPNHVWRAVMCTISLPFGRYETRHSMKYDHCRMLLLKQSGMLMLHVYTEPNQTSLSYQNRWNLWRKLTVEMDFSKHTTLKRVEMNFSMTTQQPVEQVKATDVVIKTALTMIEIRICLTLTNIEISLQLQEWDHVLLTRRMHNRCLDKLPSTIDISGAKVTKPAEWRPWPCNHGNHHLHGWIVSPEV